MGSVPLFRVLLSVVSVTPCRCVGGILPMCLPGLFVVFSPLFHDSCTREMMSCHILIYSSFIICAQLHPGNASVTVFCVHCSVVFRYFCVVFGYFCVVFGGGVPKGTFPKIRCIVFGEKSVVFSGGGPRLAM